MTRDKQQLTTNFLDLDPIENKAQYRKRYLEKHDPPLDLDIRKAKVREILDRDYPDLDKGARSLLLKYPEVVHVPGVRFVGNKTLKHKICFKGPTFYNRQYKTPQVLQSEIQNEIDELLKLDLIHPAESEYNNALLPICKKCPLTKKVKIRLMVDFRKLNKSVENIDRIPLNDVQDLINRLHGAKYFTTIDLTKGYLQIPLTEDSQKYTAFRFNGRTYTYKKMCFGLASSPGTFVRLMNIVTSGMSGIFSYMDDLIIYSNSLETHLKTLETLFKRLSFHGLELAINKSHFMKTSVEYLGYEISSQGLRPLPKLIKPMLQAQMPTTLKQARSLCSLFSFYRRFIRNFSTIAEPLINLTRGKSVLKGDKIKVEPDQKCHEALEKLKQIVAGDVVLKFPNFKNNFIIHSDASDCGIGACLSQRDANNQLRPIAFASRSLNKAERNYPTVEAEALGIIYALKQFRPIILGYNIEILTDHKPLIYLLKHCDPSGRLYRYQLALLEYNITNIAYIEGNLNFVADYLSRWSLGPDIDLEPALVCSINSLMAQASAPNYHYKTAEKVQKRPDSLVIFGGNARNVTNLDQIASLKDYKQILDSFYEKRVPVNPGSIVSTKESGSQLGSIMFSNSQNPGFAMMVTNELDRPTRPTDRQKAMSAIANDDLLISENFKVKLKNDKIHIRDYYVLICLEKIIDHCIKNKTIKHVQFIWPKAETESDKRLSNYKSLLIKFGYALWQEGVCLTVIGEPEFADLQCSALQAEAKSILLKQRLDVDDIVKDQRKDEILDNVWLELQKTNPTQSGYLLKNKGIYKLDLQSHDEDTARICIPKTKVKEVLELCHENNAHPGISRTYHECKSQMYWPTMLKDIQLHVQNCITCIKAKLSNNRQVHSGHLLLPAKANDTIAIDLLGGLPKSGRYNQILVFVCAYSRFTHCVPMATGTAKEVISHLEEYAKWYGNPSYLISDNAGAFLSCKFKEFLDQPLTHIKHHLTTSYNPCSNIAERVIKDVLSILRVLVKDKPDNWHEHLPQVNEAINYGFNLTLKQRPAALFFGREPKPSVIDYNQEVTDKIDQNEVFMKSKYARDLVERELTKAHALIDKRLESTGRLTSYELNDTVYLKRHFVADRGYKLKYQYCGPYRVTEILGNTVTLLNLASGRERRASMRNLKLYKGSDLTKMDHPNIGKIFPTADPESLEEEAFGENEIVTIEQNKPKYNLRSSVKDQKK